MIGSYILWKRTNTDLVDATLWFGCIDEILVVGSNLVLFVVVVYQSDYFDEHYHAYVVNRSSERVIIPYENLRDPSVLHCRVICGKLYITMKYFIEF